MSAAIGKIATGRKKGMGKDNDCIKLVRDEVVIMTEHDLIEGTLCYPRGIRLSDALNAPAALREKPHLPLVDATVTRIATGQRLVRSRFLLVARSQIIVIMPKSEMVRMPVGPRIKSSPDVAGAPPDQPAAVNPAPEVPQKQLPALIQSLKAADARARRSAAEALAAMGPEAKAAIPSLLETALDDDEFVRGHAMEALGNIGPEAEIAIPSLINALKDSSEFTRRIAARALGNIGQAAHPAVPALRQALRDKAEFVRSAAADALGRIGVAAESAVPALQTALDDKDVLVRHWAALALERIQEAKSTSRAQTGTTTSSL